MKKIRCTIKSVSGSKATVTFPQYGDVEITGLTIKQLVASPGLKFWFIPEVDTDVDYIKDDNGNEYIDIGSYYEDFQTEPFGGDSSKVGIEFADGTQVYWDSGNYIVNTVNKVTVSKKNGAITKINYGTTDLIQWLVELIPKCTGNLGYPIVIDPTHLALLVSMQNNPVNTVTFE